MPTLPELYRMPKRISGAPALRWVEDQHGVLRLLALLEDELGTIVEGLALRGRAFKYRPDQDVMLQMEFPHDRQRTDNAIERIEWNSSQAHNNKGRGPQALRHAMQRGTHLHAFDLNWIEGEQRMRKRNLPIAAPVSESIQGFAELLEFAGRRLMISNLTDLPCPPQERPLL